VAARLAIIAADHHKSQLGGRVEAESLSLAGFITAPSPTLREAIKSAERAKRTHQSHRSTRSELRPRRSPKRCARPPSQSTQVALRGKLGRDPNHPGMTTLGNDCRTVRSTARPAES